MMNWSDLIERFGIGTFGKIVGVKYSHAQVMKYRNSVPPDYWEAIVEAARERGWLEVDYEYLCKLKRGREEEPRRKRVGNGRMTAECVA